MTQMTDEMPEPIRTGSNLLRSAVDDLPAAPTEEQLAMFACGLVTPEQARDVTEALTHSAFLRSRLLELKSHMEYAEESGEAQRSVLSAQPIIASVFREILRSAFTAFADWDKACSDTIQGHDESPLVWGCLKDVWSTLQGSQRKSMRYATSRSGSVDARGSQRAKVVVFPGHETAVLDVVRDDDDTVIAYAKFTTPYQQPREISLYLLEKDSGWIRLGSSLTFGSEWRCIVPSISRGIDLPVGPIESHYFALAEGRWVGEKRTVLLKLTESLSKKGQSRYLRLQLKGAPKVRGDRFYMTVVLPEDVRRDFAMGRLDAGVRLGQSAFIVLGDWKVSELPEGPEIELSSDMPLPGIPDCELDYHAGLQLSLGKA